MTKRKKYLKCSSAMLFQVFPLGGHVTKPLATSLALIRLLSSVYPLVLLEVTRDSKLLPTSLHHTPEMRINIEMRKIAFVPHNYININDKSAGKRYRPCRTNMAQWQ